MTSSYQPLALELVISTSKFHTYKCGANKFFSNLRHRGCKYYQIFFVYCHT